MPGIPPDDLRVAFSCERGGRHRSCDDRVVAVIPQRVCHAHQRAASADTGDEAMQPNADLLDELGSGRMLMGEHVARILELPGGIEIVLFVLVVEQRGHSAVHALLGRGENNLTTEPTDHQHSFAADRLGHVRPKRHTDRGADHAQCDRGRPARRFATMVEESHRRMAIACATMFVAIRSLVHPLGSR